MHFRRISCVGWLTIFALGFISGAQAQELAGEEIVKRCYYKYEGDDQRSRLIVVLTDEQGKRIKHEFTRFWKNYNSKIDDVVDKTILFSEFPPSEHGINFMRWSYTQASGKPADQWVYLPEMRMVRRVSQRDPKNMDWGVNDEDLRIRALNEDTHKYIGDEVYEGREFYRVESVPRNNDPVYSKRVAWFSKTDNWDDCTASRIDYYDKHDQLNKEEFIKWSKVGDAWVWRTVVIKKANSLVSAVYDMLDVQVNVGLCDSLFSKRALERASTEINWRCEH